MTAVKSVHHVNSQKQADDGTGDKVGFSRAHPKCFPFSKQVQPHSFYNIPIALSKYESTNKTLIRLKPYGSMTSPKSYL